MARLAKLGSDRGQTMADEMLFLMPESIRHYLIVPLTGEVAESATGTWPARPPHNAGLFLDITRVLLRCLLAWDRLPRAEKGRPET